MRTRGDQEEEDGNALLAQLVAAERAVARAIREAGIDPGVAAAACAALAGEYTALATAGRSTPLAPLLREAAATLERRAAAARRALRAVTVPAGRF